MEFIQHCATGPTQAEGAPRRPQALPVVVLHKTHLSPPARNQSWAPHAFEWVHSEPYLHGILHGLKEKRPSMIIHLNMKNELEALINILEYEKYE